MPILKTNDIVNMLSELGTEKTYSYYKQHTKIKLVEITKPEGPIKFIRWAEGKPEAKGTLSVNQLGTVAAVFSRKPNYPIHFDRLFSGGGNSRSALESLLAYTPHFFMCYPQRTNIYTGEIDNKLKHIMWCPDDQHHLGEIVTKEFKQTISEIELDTEFNSFNVQPESLGNELDIEAKTVHTQMQVAIVQIGNALDCFTWIAKNDHSIKVQNTQLGKLKGVIPSLEDVPILYTPQSKKAASLVDCIWFTTDFNHIPAIIEIEHSTGVTPGLTRMLKLKETIPSIQTNYTIVAPITQRNKVVTESNNPAFISLNPKYMPYSTISELYGFITKFNITKSLHYDLIESFIEKVV